MSNSDRSKGQEDSEEEKDMQEDPEEEKDMQEDQDNEEIDVAPIVSCQETEEATVSGNADNTPPARRRRKAKHGMGKEREAELRRKRRMSMTEEQKEKERRAARERKRNQRARIKAAKAQAQPQNEEEPTSSKREKEKKAPKEKVSKRQNVTDEMERQVKDYFAYQAYKYKKGRYKDLPEEVKKKRQAGVKAYVQNLTGEKRRKFALDSYQRSLKYQARMRESDPEKWRKHQDSVNEYYRKKYASEAPEDRLRRRHKEKVNEARRRLKKQLMNQQVSEEEIQTRLEELRTTMWREFDPDFDKRIPKPRGRSRKKTPPLPPPPENVVNSETAVLDNVISTPVGHPNAESSEQESGQREVPSPLEIQLPPPIDTLSKSRQNDEEDQHFSIFASPNPWWLTSPLPPTSSPWTIQSFSPEANKSVSPEANKSVSPEANKSVSPEANKSVSPEANKSVSPEANKSVSPEANKSVSPEANKSVSPEANKSVSPEANKSISPEANKSVSSEANKSVSPEANKSKESISSIKCPHCPQSGFSNETQLISHIRSSHPEKRRKHQDSVNEYYRKKYASEAPEDRLRRRHKEKVNEAKRTLKKQLMNQQVSEEEIQTRLEELRTTMWREFDPDFDKRIPKPRGRSRKKTPPLPPPPENVVNSETAVLDNVISTPVGHPNAESSEQESGREVPSPLEIQLPPPIDTLSKSRKNNEEDQHISILASPNPWWLASPPPALSSPWTIQSFSPEANKSVSPEANKSVSPEANKSFSPEANKSVSPEANKSVSPEANKSVSPEANKSVSPEANKSKEAIYSIKCPHCPQSDFLNETQLSSHIRSSHPDKCWKCPKCSELMVSSAQLSEHYKLSHKKTEQQQQVEMMEKDEYQFVCLRCCPAENISKFKTKSDLFEHVKSKHSEHFWPCEHCNLLKYTEKALQLHLTFCKPQSTSPLSPR